MNKYFIVFTILALLSVGSVFINSLNKNTVQFSLEDDQNEYSVSFQQWNRCIHSLPKKTCDDITDTNVSACYEAAERVMNVIAPDNPQEIQSCKNFYLYFENAQINDQINRNNYFIDCYLSFEALSAALKSEYYFNQIYRPVYIVCAMSNYQIQSQKY